MKITPEPNPVNDTLTSVLTTPTEGTSALHVDNAAQRRLQESQVLELIEQSYRNYIVAEQYSGDRRGYEIR